MWIVSDNASTYKNYLIPVIAPFICMAHVFPLNGFISSATARDKSLAYALFAIAMRQLHRSVKETQMDVTTPEDLLRALHHDGGILNCPVELVSVH